MGDRAEAGITLQGTQTTGQHLTNDQSLPDGPLRASVAPKGPPEQVRRWGWTPRALASASSGGRGAGG